MQSMKRMSLTFRLTMLFAGASAAVLLASGFLISTFVERHFEELDLELLTGKMELVQHALKNVQSASDLDTLSAQLGASLVGHPDVAIAIRIADDKTLVTQGAVDFPQSLFARAIVEEGSMRTTLWTDREGNIFRGISALASTGIKNFPSPVAAVAINLSAHSHFMASFQKALWLVVVLAAIVIGFLGWIAVRRELAPVRVIKQRASEITASRLDQRLSVDSVPAELVELVQALNAMLARLEESFQRLSDFSADLAHELRTPVSNMLMQTQVILSKVRTADEYRETLYSNAEEFERLSRMMSDMLFLAKADHGLISPFKNEIDMAEEVRGLFSFFEVLAEGKKIALTLAGQGKIVGDRTLLRRAISNLLSNAIRHTPESGKVRVAIQCVSETGELLLSIENTGEPIPAEHIPRLFDRFYRADASRHGSSEGAGLGLAITKSIISLHGGTIGIRSRKGVTCFEIRMPCIDAGRNGML